MVDTISTVPDIGMLFFGIGGMIVSITIAYLIYQFGRMVRGMVDLEERYTVLEEMNVDKVAKKKGIDLAKEIMKRNLFKTKKYSFRKRLEQETFEEMFGKEKEKG